MPALMKPRLLLPAVLAALVALFIAGCGGGDDESGGSTDLASVAPPKAPMFVEFTVRPEGETKQNIETLAKDLAGVDDLGGLIVSQFEQEAEDDGEEFDYEKEVEPWLGKEAAIVGNEYVDEDFEGMIEAVQVTDADAAQAFVDEQAQSGDEGPAEDGSYEGVDYKIEQDDGSTVGVFDDLLVIAESEELFKEVVDASDGESLADEEAFTSAIAEVPDDSAADLFLDIGALIDASGDEIDSDTAFFLEATGIEPDEATMAASAIPGSDHVEIDISTNLSGENPPTGDASELLGELPGTSVAAFASAEFGKRFGESIDQIDEEGIPGEVPPNQLKKTLKKAGVDLDAITGSIGDVGAYVTGNSQSSLGGALILENEDEAQAKNTVSNIGLFLRKANVPGVTAIDGEASGFSIRSPELGRQPVVVAAKDSRIAIGYGLAPTMAGFEASGKTLADVPAYKEAGSALGGTPITAFVDGQAALKLAEAVVPPGEEEFEEAQQYLKKIEYMAIGAEASGDLAIAKLIVGVK
jgi:Protein of unknown function (DUF3352)